MNIRFFWFPIVLASCRLGSNDSNVCGAIATAMVQQLRQFSGRCGHCNVSAVAMPQPIALVDDLKDHHEPPLSHQLPHKSNWPWHQLQQQLWQSVHGQLLWPMWDGRCDVRDWHPQSTSHINRPAKAIDRDSCDDSADCCGDCNVAAVAISVMANCLDRRRHSRWGHTGFGWLLRGARPRPWPRGVIVWSEIDRLICSFCCCYLFNSLW